MDEIELLVAETFKHFRETYIPHEEHHMMPSLPRKMAIPDRPGLIYHIQNTSSIFVLRTFVSRNLAKDYQNILERPEDYPSLRLLENGLENLDTKLRYFEVENYHQAEIIHDQICNRRFPIHEELLCNLSDPGFSWWLTQKNLGFQLSFTLSNKIGDETLKLGPLGDQQLAMKSFQKLANLMSEVGFTINIQNEMNRTEFSEGEEFLLQEFRLLFEKGILGDGFSRLFKFMAAKSPRHLELETLWLYFHELAAIRRFWIQVQSELAL